MKLLQHRFLKKSNFYYFCPEETNRLILKIMEETYKKIIPEDIYITILDREPTEAERWMGIDSKCPGHRPSGNNFIDLFARLIRTYGKKDGTFYAGILGEDADNFNGAIIVMTGMPAYEWINRYLLLAASEMLEKTNMRITAIAKRLGFTPSSFSVFFKENREYTPYEWRKRSIFRTATKDKALRHPD